MATMNANFWKKSYLLEFKLDGVLTDAFTFSVPPEQEKFSFPQRKGETKTFGGIVVADYGNDAVQISLSGNTINQELKTIYKSTLGSSDLTGSEEIFYLRDLLKKYGTQDKLHRKEVYLYSLNGGTVGVKNNPKWWKIYVSSLEINRSKERPFTYCYTFEAIGDPEVTKKSNYSKKQLGWLDFLNSENGWFSKVEQLTAKAKTWANVALDYTGSFIEELNEIISFANNSIDELNSVAAAYANVIQFGFESTSSLLVDDVIGVADKIVTSAVRYYPTMASDVWNSAVNALNAFKKYETWAENIEKTYNETYWEQIKESFGVNTQNSTDEENTSSSEITEEEIADVLKTAAKLGSDAMNEMVAILKKYLNEESATVIPGNEETDDEIIFTYGYKTVEINDAQTSWDQLALDYYGDASKSYIIALYNDLPADTILEPGMKIQIPILTKTSANTENEVYNEPDVKDNYGADIAINELSNDFEVGNSGDLNCVGGPANLQQSLMGRYSTEIGARVRQESYGIQASIGDATRATSALIQASINQTTIEDPRVDSVDSIDFVGKGDNLQVEVQYTDVNGAQRTLGGII